MKLKLKRPSLNLRGKKSKNTITVEPTIERTPIIDNDPIIEDRDATNEINATEPEDERYQPVDEEREGSSPAGEVARDDDSVTTEKDEDALSTVKEEPLLEEAENAKSQGTPAEEAAPPVESIDKEVSQSVDESLTLDATATTMHMNGCNSPRVPAFCGCLSEFI